MTYQRIEEGEDCKWTEFRSQLYRFHVSGTFRMITFLEDLDDETGAQRMLRHRAETDILTGLNNRESTIEQIEGFLPVAGNQTHVLPFLDLDSFKEVNDSKGYLFGDRALQSVAGSLKRVFRSDDILGRIGGESFWFC